MIVHAGDELGGCKHVLYCFLSAGSFKRTSYFLSEARHFLSRFLQLAWRINQPFVPRNTARLNVWRVAVFQFLRCVRASSRAPFNGVAYRSVSVCACSKVFEVYV